MHFIYVSSTSKKVAMVIHPVTVQFANSQVFNAKTCFFFVDVRAVSICFTPTRTQRSGALVVASALVITVAVQQGLYK